MTDFESATRQIRMVLYFLVGFLIAAIPTFSYAAWPVTGWKFVPPSGAAASDCGTVGSAGSAAASYYGSTNSNASYKYVYSVTSADQSSGVVMYSAVRTLLSNGTTTTLTGGWGMAGCTMPVCVPPEVQDPVSGICSASCPAAGTAKPGDYVGSGGLPSELCVSGCAYRPGACMASSVGKFGCIDLVSTGAACTSTSTSSSGIPPEDPRYKCVSQGMAYGEVSGVVVCTAPSAATSGKTTTTILPAGSGSTGSTTSVTNNTTCTGDGSCSTTTTTTTTSGGSGPGGTGAGSTTSTKTEKTDQPKSTLCADNPNLSICKESSFAGSCDAAPACTGDAVQCAQANAAFELKCSAVKDDDQQKLARDAVAGNDPKAGQMPDPGNPTAVPVGTIDYTEIFAAGCPANPSFTAFGHGFSFNLAPLCSMGETLGKLNVMLALMGALWIVAGSVKGA